MLRTLPIALLLMGCFDAACGREPGAHDALLPVPKSVEDPSRDVAGSDPSVVRLRISYRSATHFEPWSAGTMHTMEANGVRMNNLEILTCHHVVDSMILMEAWDQRAGAWIPLQVAAGDPALDLAILRESERPTLGEMDVGQFDALSLQPGDRVVVHTMMSEKPQSEVQAVAIPGSVLGVSYAPYDLLFSYLSHQISGGFRVSVDGQLGPGMSGSPVYSGGDFAGIVSYGFSKGLPVAGFVPVNEIRGFLSRMRDGRLEPYGRLPISTQPMLDPVIRRHLGIPADVGGALVYDVDDPRCGIKVHDVITKVAGRPVNAHGYIQGERERTLPLQDIAAVDAQFRSEPVPVEVWRNGEVMRFDVAATDQGVLIIPMNGLGRHMSYFLAGPIAFTTATDRFVESVSHEQSHRYWFQRRRSPLMFHRFQPPTEDVEQIVVLSTHPFPSQIKNRYPDLKLGAVLERVNGERVRSIEHALRLIYGSERPTLCLTFADRGMPDVFIEKTVVIDETTAFMRKYTVPTRCSDDLAPLMDQLLRSAAEPSE